MQSGVQWRCTLCRRANYKCLSAAGAEYLNIAIKLDYIKLGIVLPRIWCMYLWCSISVTGEQVKLGSNFKFVIWWACSGRVFVYMSLCLCACAKRIYGVAPLVRCPLRIYARRKCRILQLWELLTYSAHTHRTRKPEYILLRNRNIIYRNILS